MGCQADGQLDNCFPFFPFSCIFEPMGQFHYRDAINFAGKLTFRRVMNAIKLWSSYRLSRILNRPIQWGYPMSKIGRAHV